MDFGVVILREEVDMDASLGVSSTTNNAATVVSRPDSVPVQTVPTDLAASQSVTAATATIAARNDAARSPAAPTTTTSVIFDPAMLEMIYREMDARTDQIVGQVPLEAPAAARTYRQTIVDQENAGSKQADTEA
jgi:hypothetical protein